MLRNDFFQKVLESANKELFRVIEEIMDEIKHVNPTLQMRHVVEGLQQKADFIVTGVDELCFQIAFGY